MRDPTVKPATPDIDTAAALEKIWRDPKQLRDWTFGMLLENHEPQPGSSWEAWERADAEAKRKLLRTLSRDDPLYFARLISRRRDLARLSFKQLFSRDRDLARLAQKRPRGRQPGQHAPGLREAWRTKSYIQRCWREVFGHAYGHKDLAVEIAAELYGFKPKQLANYGKNKTR